MTGASDDEPPGTGDAVRSARGVEQQVLAEMAEEERDRTLDLSQALLERLWRGDAVTVRVLGRAFDGFVVHVGDDLVTLRTVDGATVDVRIGAVLSVASLESGTGVLRALGQPDPRRFVARLRDIHADHVVFEADEGSEWLLPLATVAFVRREPPGPLA
jgi:hypothetical protein